MPELPPTLSFEESQEIDVTAFTILSSLYSRTLCHMENECKSLWQIISKMWRKWREEDFEAAGLEVPPFQTQEIESTRLLFAQGVSGDI